MPSSTELSVTNNESVAESDNANAIAPVPLVSPEPDTKEKKDVPSAFTDTPNKVKVEVEDSPVPSNEECEAQHGEAAGFSASPLGPRLRCTAESVPTTEAVTRRRRHDEERNDGDNESGGPFESAAPAEDEDLAPLSSLKKSPAVSSRHISANTANAPASHERKKRSRNSSFPPTKKLNNEQWEEMWQKLVDYKLQHGNTRVPKRYSTDPKLGTWVETQRVQFKRLLRASIASRNDGSDAERELLIDQDEIIAAADDPTHLITPSKRLNVARLHRLTEIGFTWSAKRPKTMLSLTAASTPARSFSGRSPSISSIGSSAAYTTPPYRHRNTARKRYNDTQWNEMYEKLTEYKIKHGDCLVPKKFKEDPKLGTWVETQRVLFNRDYLKDGKDPDERDGSDNGDDDEQSYGDKDVEDDAESNREENVNTPIQQAAAQNNVVANSTAAANNVSEWTKRCTVDSSVTDAEQPNDGTIFPTQMKIEDGSTESNVELTPINAQRTWTDTVSTDANPTSASAKIAAVDAVIRAHADNSMPKTPAGIGLHTNAEDESRLPNISGAHTPERKDSIILKSRAGKRLTKERKERLDALGFVWSLRAKRVDEHWDEMFAQLLEYKSRHGDCLVPSRYGENLKLGKWVETQRYEYTKLLRAKTQALEINGEELCTPSKTIKIMPATPEGREVLNTSATSVKVPRSVTLRLTEERLNKLESIGFEWKVKNKMKRYYAKQWDIMFERLLQFKAETGDCLVPKRYPPDIKLGTWVHTQRIQYRKLMQGMSKKEGVKTNHGDGDEIAIEAENEAYDEDEEDGDDTYFRLTVDRKQRLEDVGFVWTCRDSTTVKPRKTIPSPSPAVTLTRNSFDDQWDAMFERLQAYKQKNGDCLVPKRFNDDQKLGTWVDTQRVQYKKLTKKLAATGEHSVNTGLGIDDDQSVLSSPIMQQGKPLIGRLTDDRIKRLEELGFVWSLRDDWQKHYNELRAYKHEHGNCNVPSRYQTNRRLGIWVSAQRQQYKAMVTRADDDESRRASPLTAAKIALLDELGFTWMIRTRDSLGESWSQRLEDLRKYKEEHGNCLVPSRYPPNPELGVWVGTQRTQYRVYTKLKEAGIKIEADDGTYATSMNDERVAQLEELGFVWALRSSSDKLWKKRMDELQLYKNEHGNCLVPEKYKPNPRLGKWVTTQKTQYRLFNEGQPSSLDQGKIDELDGMGFEWFAGEASHSAEVSSTMMMQSFDTSAMISMSDVEPAPVNIAFSNDAVSMSVAADIAVTAGAEADVMAGV